MAQSGRNLFIGEKSNVGCEFSDFGIGEGSDITCEYNDDRRANERVYMATFNDDCEGEPTLKDITPAGIEDDDLTEIRGFACVDLSERNAGDEDVPDDDDI